MFKPSTVAPTFIKALFTLWLLANSLPNLLFLDKSSEQVSTRSPKPDNPTNVDSLAPSDFPSLVISANPRVISAACVFIPYPRPEAIPAAIARIFLTDPPTSTPIISSLV